MKLKADLDFEVPSAETQQCSVTYDISTFIFGVLWVTLEFLGFRAFGKKKKVIKKITKKRGCLSSLPKFNWLKSTCYQTVWKY